MTMTILSLPNECLQTICHQVAGVGDLYSLSQTCRRFYDASVYDLYRRDLDSSTRPNVGTAIPWAIKYDVLETVQRATCLGIVAPSHLTMAASGRMPEMFRLLWDCMERSGNVEINDDGSGNSPFIAAVGLFPNIAHLMLATGKVQVNYQNAMEDTALMVAAHNGDSDLVEKLLELGARHSTRDGEQRTALSLACGPHGESCDCGRDPDSSSCGECMGYGGCDDCIGGSNLRLVPQTDRNEHLRTVQLLISAGAEIDVTDVNGFTPLHHAAAAGHLGVIQLLVNHGANVNARTQDEETPLACNSKGKCDFEIVEFLVNEGSDVDTEALCLSHLTKEPIKVARFLLQHGANVVSSGGRSPLYCSVQFPDPELTELFLDLGADINGGRYPWGTPLSSACREPDSAAVIKLLVDRGADVTLSGDNGLYSPLRIAIQTQLPADVIKLLLDNGADANDKKTGMEVLRSAVSLGSLETTQILIQYGANPDNLDDNNQNCLYNAAKNGDMAMLELLHKHGALIEHACGSGENIISVAMHHSNSFQLVEWLIRNGADVNKDNGSGTTPLHSATFCREAQITKLLLEHGAKFDMENIAGETPLGHISSWCELFSTKQELFVDCGSGPTLLKPSWVADLNNLPVLLKVVDVLISHQHLEIGGWTY